MRFAFSTSIDPAWDLPAIISQAKKHGYDGVELHATSSGENSNEFDAFLTDPSKTQKTFEDSGLRVACLRTDIGMTMDRRADARSADAIRAAIDSAAAMNCRCVQLVDIHLHDRHDAASAMMRLGDWLLPLGDYAAQGDVTLVIANGPAFPRATQMWKLLDRIAHPAIGCAWSLLNATLAGESPRVSVPLLNTSIQYAWVQDAKLIGDSSVSCALGEGELPVREFLHALAGIGYGGWITMSGRRPFVSDGGEASIADVLSGAIANLRAWTQPSPVASPAAIRVAAARAARPGHA